MNFDGVRGMKTALDAYAKRNEAINNNLANVNTPRYKREYVKFEEYLESNQKFYLSGVKTNERHLDIPKKMSKSAMLVKDRSYSTRLDGNNVNADVEAAEQIKNSISYNAVAQRLSGFFQSMRTAISEGGK